MTLPDFYPDESLSESELLALVASETLVRLLSFQEGKLKLCIETAQLLEAAPYVEDFTSNGVRGHVFANRLMSRVEVLMNLSVKDLLVLRRGYGS